MIHLRIRRYDSDDWTLLSISPADEEEDDIFRLIVGAIAWSNYQAEVMNEDEEWEELE